MMGVSAEERYESYTYIYFYTGRRKNNNNKQC